MPITATPAKVSRLFAAFRRARPGQKNDIQRLKVLKQMVGQLRSSERRHWSQVVAETQAFHERRTAILGSLA